VLLERKHAVTSLSAVGTRYCLLAITYYSRLQKRHVHANLRVMLTAGISCCSPHPEVAVSGQHDHCCMGKQLPVCGGRCLHNHGLPSALGDLCQQRRSTLVMGCDQRVGGRQQAPLGLLVAGRL
jgi:hypothetical protein